VEPLALESLRVVVQQPLVLGPRENLSVATLLVDEKPRTGEGVQHGIEQRTAVDVVFHTGVTVRSVKSVCLRYAARRRGI